MPGTRPLFKLTPDSSLLPTFLPSAHVLCRPFGRSYPNSQPTSRKFTNFLAPLRSPVQARTASRSARFLSSYSVLRKFRSSLESIQRRYMPNPILSPCVDFGQDRTSRNSGFPNLPQMYHVPCLHPPSTSTPTRDLVPLLRLPMTISIR